MIFEFNGLNLLNQILISYCLGVLVYLIYNNYATGLALLRLVSVKNTKTNSVSVLRDIFNLNMLYLAFILFLVYILIMIVIPEIFYCLSDSFIVEASSGSGTVPADTAANANTGEISTGNIKTENTGASKNISKATDGAIMATAMAGGMKLAQKSPNLAVKTGFVAGSIVAGAGAVAIKNIAGNITEDIGKNIIFTYFIIRNDSSSLEGKDEINISKNINEFD